MTVAIDFIKNIVEVDVDGIRHINHYKIKEAYNKKIKDQYGEYAEYVEKTIDEFEYSWKDIEKDGGIEQINKELKECYGENCFC